MGYKYASPHVLCPFLLWSPSYPDDSENSSVQLFTQGQLGQVKRRGLREVEERETQTQGEKKKGAKDKRREKARERGEEMGKKIRHIFTLSPRVRPRNVLPS